MQLVDQPYLAPGCCVLSNEGGPDNGPYIDLLREDNYGNRLYVSVQTVKDLARFIGGGGPEEVAALAEVTEAYEALQERFAALELEKAQQDAAIATTLSVGAVFDKKTLRPKLRKAHLGMVLEDAEV